MKGKFFLAVIIALLSPLSVFAQTPTVQTRKATSVSSTPGGSANITIWATLNGIVNANGTNCSVSFEYGNTTSYGITVAAAPGTVTGSTDNAVSAGVTLNYTHTGPQARIIHYRLKVVNENNTYYSRDFIATPIDPRRNIGIVATCSDSPTMANFDMMNRNLFDVTVDYSAGASYTGSVIIGSQQIQQIFVGKQSVCSFSYHYTLFRQVLTNDQLCSETLLPKNNIFMTATGRISTDKMMYRIENANGSAVAIAITNGSDIYPYTIAAQSVAYFVGGVNGGSMISISEEPFAISEPSTFSYEGMGWLAVTPLSSTVTTANFELYNRDDAAHTFVMRNVGGTEYSYTLSAYENRTVTLANENWDVYTTVWDPTGMIYGPPWNNKYTGPVFGDATSFYNGLLKIAVATPAAVVQLTPILTSLTANSSTSFTASGTIAGNPAQSETVDYYFVYGTDPNNLNLSTPTQQVVIPANQDANVSATVGGLASENLYYCKLVVGLNQSSRKEVLLTSLPATNLKMWLRADLNVTSLGSAVSNWGDVSGSYNDATQTTSGNQPTVVSNVINGKPVIRFNGTTSKMSLPTSTDLGIRSNPYEIFVVGKSSSGNVQFLFAGGATEQFEYHLNGVGARFIPTTATYLDLGASGNYANGNAHVFSARASGSGGAVRVDGMDGGTSSSNILSASSANLLLGVRSDNTYFFNGDIAEVILYNAILSTTDRNTVEQYLANRYNITSGALPVELTSFSAECKENSVELKWQTATEVNNYGFEIQRLAVSNQQLANGWVAISFVKGHGNSNSTKDYSFTDEPKGGREFKYRLKQIDFDGKYEYSKTVEVSFEAPTVFKLEQNYPNPFNPSTTIRYSVPVVEALSGAEVHVSLKVYDVLGRELAILVDEKQKAGYYNSKLNIKNYKLPSGVYFYRLQAGGFIQTKKLIVVK